MSIRAVNTRSFFLPSPPSLSSVPRFFPSYRRLPAVRFHPPTSPCHGCLTQRRSIQSLFESVMEELKSIRKSRKKIVSVNASSSNVELLNEELIEDRLLNRSLEKGLVLEFKKDSDRVLLAVAQRPDGKKNWMVLDQNGVTSSIKRQQVTYIVPGISNFDQAEIAAFVQKAQDNMDPSLLEFAWSELLEKNKSVTVEEMAEIIFGSVEPLESYSAHLLLFKDEVYFTVVKTTGLRRVYGPRPHEQVEELIRRKVAKEAAEKEFQEFIKLLGSVKSMPSQDKPSKSSWKDDEKIWSRIKSLEAYAIDDCRSDEQRKTAGMLALMKKEKQTYDQAKFWSYSMSDKAIVICKKDKDQQPGILRTLQIFTQKIERNNFQGQLETHQEFCRIVKSSGDHKCHYCKEN